MTWFVLTLVAYALFAIVFVTDKALLGAQRTSINRPLVYALYSGLFAAVTALLLPLVPSPVPRSLLLPLILAAVLHLGALWLFFSALKRGEPSRVVPLTGSTVPLFTLLFAVAFLGEVLSRIQLTGIGLLVIGGGLLSFSLSRRALVARRALVLALLSGAAFAAYFSLMKSLYASHDSFLVVFVYSRLVAAALALGLLIPVLWLPAIRRKRLVPRRPQRRPGTSGPILTPTTGLFVGNKVLAAVAFLLQSYAIREGSVTVVNALQGTQYLFVLVLALMVSRWRPALVREELHRVALGQKIVGIGSIIVAVALLV